MKYSINSVSAMIGDTIGDSDTINIVSSFTGLDNKSSKELCEILGIVTFIYCVKKSGVHQQKDSSLSKEQK